MYPVRFTLRVDMETILNAFDSLSMRLICYPAKAFPVTHISTVYSLRELSTTLASGL